MKESAVGREQVQLDGEEGTIPMTDKISAEFLEQVAEYGTGQALRCLALAYRDMPSSHSVVIAPRLEP